MSIASLITQAIETFLSRAIRSTVAYISGGKLIVVRTLAVLGAFFFAATRFAFWGFRLAVIVGRWVECRVIIPMNRA